MMSMLFVHTITSGIKAYAAFSKRPLPIWFDWIDTTSLCILLFPTKLEARMLVIWFLFSGTFIAGKIVGYYGYKRTAGTIFGALGILSTSYAIYCARRPQELPVGEKEALLKADIEGEKPAAMVA